MNKITELWKIFKKATDYFFFKVGNTFRRRKIEAVYYNKHMDEIVVHLEDCSYTEVFCGRRIALCKKNHIFGKRYIGFALYGIRHFLITQQLEMYGPRQVGDILEKMVERCPAEEFPSERLAVILRILEKHELGVDIPDPVKR